MNKINDLREKLRKIGENPTLSIDDIDLLLIKAGTLLAQEHPLDALELDLS